MTRAFAIRATEIIVMPKGRAMPTARAATASQPSLLRVSGVAGIAIAAVSIAYFAGQLLRGWLS